MKARAPMLGGFGLASDEIVVDSFAGGGGASTGIELGLGRSIDIAINHDPAAISMHRANHPGAKHYCESVWDVDPIEACGGRRVGLAWFSPDCTHFSKAKGGKPRSKEIRGLAWIVTRWARAVAPRIILLENVEEFATWGPIDDDGHPIKERAGETFEEWKAELRSLGYALDFKTIVAADHGAPTTRKRLFMVARNDGLPIVWPTASHGEGRAHPWRPASEIIDWTVPCPSIFERAKPLADATLRRISVGIHRYVLSTAKPFIVPVTHPRDARVHSIDDPLRTVTAANRGELALVQPFIASNYGSSVGRAIDDPMPTVTAGGGGHQSLIAPTLIQTGYGEREGQAPRTLDIGKPLGTVVAGGAKHGLVAALITKHYGGMVGHKPDRTLGTVTTQDHHAVTSAFLTKFYGTSIGSDVRDPLPTVTAGGHRGGGHLAAVRLLLERFNSLSVRNGADTAQTALFDAAPRSTDFLVNVGGEQYEIADIGMRMLQPRELFAAQGFPNDYQISPEHEGRPLTKTAQIALAGNSVCPAVACALVQANVFLTVEAAA